MKLIRILFLVLGFLSTLESRAEGIFTISPKADASRLLQRTMGLADTIPFYTPQEVVGVGLHGRVVLHGDNSFVKVLLDSEYGEDCFLALFASRMTAGTDSLVLDGYGEETAAMEPLKCRRLRVYTHEATFVLDSVSLVNSTPARKAKFSPAFRKAQMRRQAEARVQHINAYNESRGKLWRAAVTPLSEQPYEIRRRAFSLPDECSSQGMEYYAGGIFDLGVEMPEPQAMASRVSTPIPKHVESFDWRNRHGKNWITSVKHQGESNYCWAFAPVAALEGVVNLYYNQKIDMDLSEQDVGYYAYSDCYGYRVGGNSGTALRYIQRNGVIDEETLPFMDYCPVPLPDQRTKNYNECVSISGFSSVSLWNPDSVSLERIKENLIKRGPLVSGFEWYPNGLIDPGERIGHAMALVGYGVIRAGDTLTYYNHTSGQRYFVIQDDSPYIGKTYWIFKNSYGVNHDHGHEGYIYTLFANLKSFLGSYAIHTPLVSLNYSDQDIQCTDEDGDGYYFWGIGPRPASCPVWAPEEPDGDDSDYSAGPLDSLGYKKSNSPDLQDTLYVDQNTTWDSYRYLHRHVCVCNGATLTIQSEVRCYDGVSFTILPAATLAVSGGKVNNALLKPRSGGNVLLINQGEILLPCGRDVEFPIGVGLLMNSGSIVPDSMNNKSNE